MDFTSSQVVALLTAVSQIVNPYQQLSKTLHKYQYELLYPQDIFNVLVALIVVHFVLFLQSIVSLVLKVLMKKRTKRKIWLWKKLYCTESQTIPYYVPNGEFAIEIFQSLGCICFVLFGFITYFSIKKPDADGTTQQFLWMSVSFAPGFIGSWLYGFSTIYLVLFTPGQAERFTIAKKLRIMNPVLMNIFCIGAPIIIGLTFAGLGIGLDQLYTREVRAYRSLQTLLGSLSNEWNSGDTNPAKIQTLLPALDRLRAVINVYLNLCKATCYCWAVVSAVFVIFYCVTTLAICKSLKYTSDVASGKTALLSGKGSEKASRIDAKTPATSTQKQGGPKISFEIAPNLEFAKKIHRSYQFLACHCAMIAMSLSFYFIASLVLATNFAKVVTEQHWRAACFWLVAFCALLISGALCLQSVWSIISNRQHKQHLPALENNLRSIDSVDFQVQNLMPRDQKQTDNANPSAETMRNGLGTNISIVCA